MFFEIFKKFTLQLFADSGTNVNTTGGTVNSYTGDKTTSTAMSPQLKTFYDTELLENARVELYYAQFAMKQPLPKNHGKTVEWRKWNTFQRATQLQEGVIPTGQNFGSTTKTGSINQYGTYVSVSDTLEMRAYDDVILGATTEMGASAAETQEILIRDALMTNTNVLYCDNIESDGSFVSKPEGVTGMKCKDGVMSTLTPDMVAKAVTQLKKNRVPTIGGKYVAVIHPSVAYDLRKSKEWIEAHKYAGVNEIYNGEIGELHGCRFVEDVFAPVKKETIADSITAATYATFFFGKDSFGIIDPEGGALEMIIKDKSQAGGPLNQFSTIGYKFETNGATILYPERLLRVMSCSSYSATDEAN